MTPEEAVNRLNAAGLPTELRNEPYCLFIGGTRVADLWGVDVHMEAFKVFRQDGGYVLFAPVVVGAAGCGTRTEYLNTLAAAVDRVLAIYDRRIDE